MAFLFSLSQTTNLVFTIFTLFLLAKITKTLLTKSKNTNKSPPKATGSWPIIGHLHLLSNPLELPHETLSKMADKFGSIFKLNIGLQPALVISNWEIAKECFTKNDSAFVDRTNSIAVEVMGYNYAMFGLGPYGPYWREMRKISTLELFSNRRVELLSHTISIEMKTALKELYGVKEEMIDMKKWLGDLTFNIMTTIVAGKRCSKDEKQEKQQYQENQEEMMRVKRALREFFELLGVFLVGDAIPFLRWFDIGGYEGSMKKVAKKIDFIFQKWLNEHREKTGSVKNEEQDFMDVLISIFEGNNAMENHSTFDLDSIIKSTCLVAMSGGTDTTTVTMTWALSLLLNNPKTMQKAREELDLYVGKDRQVEETDMKKLVYLQAIIKETFRLYPPGPLLAPRASISDCTVAGYHIPKGTRLLVNAWKMHRDPNLWSDPDEFIPERFLTTHKNVDFRGQHFELIPFGSGRRVCPGISLTIHVVQLTLARLIHGFEINTSENISVDMTGSIGMTNMKATPLEVILKPRLSSGLYE